MRALPRAFSLTLTIAARTSRAQMCRRQDCSPSSVNSGHPAASRLLAPRRTSCPHRLTRRSARAASEACPCGGPASGFYAEVGDRRRCQFLGPRSGEFQPAQERGRRDRRGGGEGFAVLIRQSRPPLRPHPAAASGARRRNCRHDRARVPGPATIARTWRFTDRACRRAISLSRHSALPSLNRPGVLPPERRAFRSSARPPAGAAPRP
jgi:hypothetical protein